MQHSFLSFGLRICSEIECGYFPAASGPPDVYVRLGSVPESLEAARSKGILFQASSGKFLLRIDGVARYLISRGREIVIHPHPASDFDSIRLFLLGPVFGALLHQRNILPLHASAIATPSGAVAFAGHSGSGKSTIACGFHLKGYPVLADELCAVAIEPWPRIMRGGDYLMLWTEALKEFGLERLGLRRVRPQIEKFLFPLKDSFAAESAQLRAVYIIEPSNSDLSSPTPVTGLNKIHLLAQNIYRPQYVEDMDPEPSHLRALAALAQSIPVRKIGRPRREGLQLRELVDLIEGDLGG